jgi:hypothetical protein
MHYKQKYLKYKNKYIKLKNQIGGSCSINIDEYIENEQKYMKNNLSYLDENEKKSPVINKINKLIEIISPIISKIPHEYNFVTYLTRELISYIYNIRLLRPFNMLYKLAVLPCTELFIKEHISNLNQEYIDKLKLKDPSNLEEYLITRSHGKANSIAKVLLEGYDLANSDNYIWGKRNLTEEEKKIFIINKISDIPIGLCTRDKQIYIIEENLEIIHHKDSEEGRMFTDCKTIQSVIDKIKNELSQLILNNLFSYIDSIPEDKRNTHEYYINIEQIINKLPDHNLFIANDDNPNYNKLGYNPFDKNISRDNPSPDEESFAFKGTFLHPNNLLKNMGMIYIKNKNNNEKIYSDGFFHLRYTIYDAPSSKVIDKYGKYIKESLVT